MTDPIEQRIVQPAAHDARDSRSHLIIYAAGAAVVAGIIGLALLWWGQHGQITQLRADGNTTASQAQQLANQVRSLGGTPVVEPASPGPSGPVGANGTNGTNGTNGRDGRDGQSPPCLSTPQQCQGVNGANGQNGVDGKDGQAGTNGKDGVNGKDGANGKDGLNGQPGIDGKDGQPPSGWTTTYPDGSTETCQRAANFDPASPQYECTVQPAGGSSTPATTSAVLPFVRRRQRGA